MRRWLISTERTAGEAVTRAGGDPRAIADGRVFLGKRRVAREDEPVRAGDELTLAPPVAAAPPAKILARAGDVVVAEKPAGTPTIPDHAGASHALVAAIARALGIDVARVHPVSRLDRDVSGAVTVALSKEAAARLADARARGGFARRYVAIAASAPSPDRGTWSWPIGRAKDPRLRAVNGRDPAPAESRYATVARAGAFALLALAPITGRTHQLRVHAARAGAPLVGDRAYGGPARVVLPSGRVIAPARIALHAARVAIDLGPGTRLEAASPVPAELTDLWLALGGEGSAWDMAVSCTLDASP